MTIKKASKRMYRKIAVGILLASTLAIGGCSNLGGCDSLALCDDFSKVNDPNFKIITAGVVNYTTHSVGRVHLLPLNKNDIDDGAIIGVAARTPMNANEWSTGGGGMPALAWDFRWKLPKKFKVWWTVIHDDKLYDASKTYMKDGKPFDPYDPYITKETRPGLVWCEAEVEIKHPVIKDRSSKLALYFYPDGHVEGDIGGIPMSKLDIQKRSELPVSDKPCAKEISNPYYGKKKPVHFTY
ncbi:DUF3304 domain-containing protein [Herbaspirillum sp. RV1423]|uniref:DUF3304 domain-containing protein n=1 Tax=Herbaspirillum sp. RV1423 TaxID=1443993 RepID=UPI0018CBFA34|nr:DUF3304 domain-containing protein [Herbaspirillum sp. RV1423]